MSNRALRPAIVVVAVLLIASLVTVFWPREDVVRVSASFPRAVGVYEGSDVRVLGVRIGRVTGVTPEGTSVRVDMEYSAEHTVPADAKAAVITPSVVSDRYVQLTPAYSGGPVMRDGTRIPLERTAVPVELDRVFSTLNELTVALGPEGANEDGSLSRLLGVTADNLEGQGERVHQTVEDLSTALTTLAEGRDDLFGTVRNLQAFTSALAANDKHVREFNQQLSAVAEQLAGEREELAAALSNLAVALDEVTSFVRENREVLAADLDQLSEITGILVKQRRALEEVLDTAPTALGNLHLAYNPTSGTLDTRMDAEQFEDPGLYLCSLLRALDTRDTEGGSVDCGALREAFAQLPEGGAPRPGVSARTPRLPGNLLPDALGLGGLLGGDR